MFAPPNRPMSSSQLMRAGESQQFANQLGRRIMPQPQQTPTTFQPRPFTQLGMPRATNYFRAMM